MEEQDATVVSLPSVSTTQINWVKSEANYTRAKYAAPWIIRLCKGLWRELQPYKHEHVSSAVHYTSGSQLINELIRLSGKSDRLLASGVWQLLLEESAIEPCDHQGKSISAADAKVEEFVDDLSRYYRCCCPPYHMTSLDEELQQLNQHPLSTCLVATGKHRIDTLRKYASASVHTDSVENDENSVDRFSLLLDRVYELASDAVFRRILLKPCNQRTQTELEFVFSELSTSPSLGQLSISVRKELSKCINYEVHREAGALIFRQGDPGDSWYIIHRGSVWVHVDGQGYVCRLSEGDDFGKLAIVTGSERAASIILAENNCHFLRVDKNDFTRILTDVEESRVRLREGESDVLILERCAGVLPANDKIKLS
ncbi:unnamed protein product [Dicrocoelium dendriticum]|nr:unnamed protein product [Dicrocoelium dendriticum]